MRDEIEGLLTGYEEGRLDRDALLDQLATMVGEPAAGSARTAGEHDPVFVSRGLNHVALSVSDVGETAAFLGQHLGTTVIELGPDRGFVACGANNFVGLFRRPPTGLDHLCFTVEGYEPDDAVARLLDAGISPHRTEDRVFFRGPDGIMLQVADYWGDFPTAGES